MNPNTSTQLKHTPFSVSPKNAILFSESSPHLNSPTTTFPLNQLLKKVRNHTVITTNITANYFHTFVHPIMKAARNCKDFTFIHDAKRIEIDAVSLQIILPTPYHQDVWRMRKGILENLHRGSIILEDKQEIFFSFSYTDAEKKAIKILDIPYMLLSLADMYNKDIHARLGGTQVSMEKLPLPGDLSYELSTFRIMMDYLVEEAQLQQVEVKSY